jgi:hypothetical protein
MFTYTRAYAYMTQLIYFSSVNVYSDGSVCNPLNFAFFRLSFYVEFPSEDESR